MNKIWCGQIDFGHIKIDNIDDFNLYLKTLEGKRVDVIIRKYRKNRTENANRYLWGVVYKLIADELGYSTDEIHALLKGMFLKKAVFIKQKRYDVIRSTANLTTDEFSEYIESCKRFASQELSVMIPDPNEVIF